MNFSFSAGGILTTTAWAAARKMLGLLPEDWQNAINNNPVSKDIFKEYVEFNRGVIPKITASNNIPANILEIGSTTLYGASGRSYVSMVLEIIGSNQYLVLPCINGFPKIQMHTEANRRPVATNKAPVTTNRRPEPIVYKFEFPIQYLRVYGSNTIENDEAYIKNRLERKQKNSIGFLSRSKLVGEKQIRSINTYEQIITHLRQFQTQHGCYLYLGFGSPRIEVTCSLDISTQKDKMDCVYVAMVLTETQRFDFTKAKSSFKNSMDVSQIVSGKKVSNANKNGIMGQ